jgi:hypothetical protein
MTKDVNGAGEARGEIRAVLQAAEKATLRVVMVRVFTAENGPWDAISKGEHKNSGVRQVPGGGYEPKRGAENLLPFKFFSLYLNGSVGS